MRQNPTENGSHAMDILFSLLLFGVFAIVGVTLVLIGARVYRTTADGLDKNYTSRTAIAYVQEKIRQSDQAGAITLASADDVFSDGADFAGSASGDVLILRETVDGAAYCTYIYYNDGYLTELFAKADAAVTRSQGTKLIELADFQITREDDGRYTLLASLADGETVQAAIRPRCGEKEGL